MHFHPHCVGLSAEPAFGAWTCLTCTGKDTSQFPERSTVSKKQKTEHSSQIRENLCDRFKRSKAEFLAKNVSFFEALCDHERLNYAVDTIDSVSAADNFNLSMIESKPQFVNADLYQYQIEGIDWLIKCFDRGVGGILGDESGLGKTLQTLSLLAYLKCTAKLLGPHLIVAPITVLPKWKREIQRFTPCLSFCTIDGSIGERRKILSDPTVASGGKDVFLTTFEAMQAEPFFAEPKFAWSSLTVAEGHRLASQGPALGGVLRRVPCQFRLLLTGEPVLGGTLPDLISLLGFILPDLFPEEPGGASRGDAARDEGALRVRAAAALEALFTLRRRRADVGDLPPPAPVRTLRVPLSAGQRQWYRRALVGVDPTDAGGAAALLPVLASLRRIWSHPGLLAVERAAAAGPGPPDLPAPADPGANGRAAGKEGPAAPDPTCGAPVSDSGKLALLDRLLARLRGGGRRVLVLYQVTRDASARHPRRAPEQRALRAAFRNGGGARRSRPPQAARVPRL